jgi:glutamine amidotransferase
MITAVVDYGVGNLGAIPNMLDRLGASAVITSDPAILEEAERIVLPGVGAFGAGMARLNEGGLIPILEKRVLQDRVPTLGLCLGMQLLFEGSDESDAAGLGWLPGRVVKFRSTGAPRDLPIPHMGWSELNIIRPTPLLHQLGDEPRFYFAHSYHAQPADLEDIVATAAYRYEFAAVIQHLNIYGAQFHPEKSHRFGLQLFKNFLNL